MAHPIRVGFDLDGVLLYNPARIIRPVIALLKKKKIAIKRKTLEFYVPQTRKEEIIWELFHKSSLFMAPGFGQIKELKAAGVIEPYLITGRFAHLKPDFQKWQQRLKTSEIFQACYLNDQNEQPHLFKARLIKQLHLSCFVEDNWDIVNYLNQTSTDWPTTNHDAPQKSKTGPAPWPVKVYWIANFFDRQIAYPHKFSNLQAVLADLARQE